MKFVILMVLTVAAAVSASANAPSKKRLLREEWKEYKLIHNKKYKSNEEDTLHMKTFAESKARVAEWNQAYLRGEKTYKIGINQFSDMPVDDFNSKMNGYIPKFKHRMDLKINRSSILGGDNVKLPYAVNWVKLGAVTPVKDQNLCASCWAFSATGALEGQYFRKKNKLISLSEQNLIDCSGIDTPFNNFGCSGGNTDTALQYVYCNGGIDKEYNYPYEGCEKRCRYKRKWKSGVMEKNVHYITEGSEDELQYYVTLYGPVSVSIDANHTSFKDYADGIYIEKNCNADAPNHAMLVVGYGTDKRTGYDYWLVKNSYGDKWGEKGYIKMIRNHYGNCGIANWATYPVV